MKDSLKFKLIYIFEFAAMGVLIPLIGQYLSWIGFSGTEIGTITAMGTAIAVVASAFWGKIYSNAKDGRYLILFLCVATAVMAVSSVFTRTFILFTILYAIMYFFQGPINGLSDAMVLDRGIEYASIRLWGAIGYSVSVFIGGRVGQYFGLDKIFYIYAISFFICGALILTVKNKVNNREKTEKEVSKQIYKIGYGHVLRDKKAMQLIIVGTFVIGSAIANNTYFGFLFRDGGGDVAGIGTAMLLMAGSEAVIMPFAPILAKKFSQEKILVAAMVLSTLRFVWYATGPSYKFLLAVFFIQGMINGVLLVEYVKYISKVVDKRLIGIVISAYYAVSSNGGIILCNFFGGIAMDRFGSTGVFALFTILNTVGIVLYFMFGLHKVHKEEK